MNRYVLNGLRWSRALVVALRMTWGVSGALAVDSVGAAETTAGGEPTLVLTTADQVHRLTREEATRPHGVAIQAVVTCALRGFSALL